PLLVTQSPGGVHPITGFTGYIQDITSSEERRVGKKWSTPDFRPGFTANNYVVFRFTPQTLALTSLLASAAGQGCSPALTVTSVAEEANGDILLNASTGTAFAGIAAGTYGLFQLDPDTGALTPLLVTQSPGGVHPITGFTGYIQDIT